MGFGYGESIAAGYRSLALLRRGRDYETYDAWSTARQARCVVKVLRPDKQESTSSRDRLLREGQLLVTLTHPHIVRGYEVQATPRPALALETLGGATLGHLLGGENRLSVVSVAHLGQQIASALLYLHGHGYLHLDLKPDNIIIEGSRARLIDLSLVQHPGPVAQGLGTGAYLSPEQGRGTEASAASDVWGLGLTMYEAVTGTNPYESRRVGSGSAQRTPSAGRRSASRHCSTCGESMNFRQTSERAPSVRRGRRMPRALSEIIDGALDLVPGNRPSVSDIRRRMVEITGGDEPPW
jgi:eukaryotic-like serine/threonine-protein kinase